VEAKKHDDAFTLSTVFFAAVLFFGSVSLRLAWWPLRVTVFTLGTFMLVIGLVWVLSQPTE
jgi:predicted transporter